MTGAELRALREAHGWSQYQVARATGYTPSAAHGWEMGHCRVPPTVVAWATALPAVPVVSTYPPTVGGLVKYLQRHAMRLIELADFCGVAESTVERWVVGRRRLPPALQAWLRAGCPPFWRWAPEELGANVLSVDGKRPGLRAGLRPIAHREQRTSRTLARLRRGQPARDDPAWTCAECGRAQPVGARRRGLCPACYQRGRARAARKTVAA